MVVEATGRESTRRGDRDPRRSDGGRFARVLATRRARRPGDHEDDARERRAYVETVVPSARAQAATPTSIDPVSPRADVAGRVERIAALAVERARLGDACRVDAAVTLSDGEVVDVAVRATAREVEVRIVAPAVAAASIDAARPRLLERLAARGIRVRACEVATRGLGPDGARR